MSTPPLIRHATSKDIESLLDLYRHLNKDDDRCAPERAQKIFSDFLRYAGCAILIGKIGEILVASCTVVIVPNLTRGGTPYGLIENVVTHTDYRTRGYGTQMLDAASQLAWDNNCYKVMLMTGSQKRGTLAFYQRAGFSQTKTGFQKRRMTVRQDR